MAIHDIKSTINAGHFVLFNQVDLNTTIEGLLRKKSGTALTVRELNSAELFHIYNLQQILSLVDRGLLAPIEQTTKTITFHPDIAKKIRDNYSERGGQLKLQTDNHVFLNANVDEMSDEILKLFIKKLEELSTLHSEEVLLLPKKEAPQAEAKETPLAKKTPKASRSTKTTQKPSQQAAKFNNPLAAKIAIETRKAQKRIYNKAVAELEAAKEKDRKHKKEDIIVYEQQQGVIDADQAKARQRKTDRMK